MARNNVGGLKAKRFFEFEGQKIPIAKDESTELYEEREDGTVNEKPITVLLGYTGDLSEGSTFTVKRLGEALAYRVVLVELEIDVHPGLGKYGQVRRRLLVEEIEDEK